MLKSTLPFAIAIINGPQNVFKPCPHKVQMPVNRGW